MNNKVYSFFILSVLLSLVLTILPLPFWAIWFRPMWICLTIVYWVIETPHQVGLFTAWIIGISLDVLNGTLLGEHALALTFVAYLAAKMERRFRAIPFWQQTFYVLIFLAFYQAFFFVIQGLTGAMIEDARFWLAPIISAFIWPWWAMVLRKCQLKLMVA
jgi:rod shape-determining protein MreD